MIIFIEIWRSNKNPIQKLWSLNLITATLQSQNCHLSYGGSNKKAPEKVPSEQAKKQLTHVKNFTSWHYNKTAEIRQLLKKRTKAVKYRVLFERLKG